MKPLTERRVPATCVVDYIDAMNYEVIVTGGPGYEDYTRTYTVKATSEKDAAFSGLAQFVAEMEALEDANLKDD